MRVDTLFEAPRGQAGVYLAHDFIGADECEALRARVGPQLVAAGEYGAFDANEADPALVKQRISRTQCALTTVVVGGHVVNCRLILFFCFGSSSAPQHISRTDSSSRKAQAGSVTPDLADPDDPLAALQVRVVVVGFSGDLSLPSILGR